MKLKPLDRFCSDVCKGDLIRVIFEDNREFSGYAYSTSLDMLPSRIVLSRSYPHSYISNPFNTIQILDLSRTHYEILRRAKSRKTTNSHPSKSSSH